MHFGAGRRSRGVVLVITLGTGVGSAMFVDGRLVPNAELGHIPYRGESIERYMAESARERENLDWETWAGRLQEYFSLVEFLFSPTLIIVGGGRSEEHTSELQSRGHLVCRLLLEKKKKHTRAIKSNKLNYVKIT